MVMTPPAEAWLQTYLGRELRVPEFNEDAITLEETATVLSRICRFGGRVLVPYSVAEHSVRVAELVCRMGGSAVEQFVAINHEIDEAILGFDPPAPLLRLLPDLRQLKEAAYRAGMRRYGLPEAMPEVVKHADAVLLATEKRDLMREPPRKWQKLPDPLPDRIEPWTRGAPPRMRFRARWKVLAAAAGFEGEE